MAEAAQKGEGFRLNMALLLRIWLLATVGLIGGAMVWEFVPVLIPMAAVGIVLGGVAVGMIAIARAIERNRGGPREPAD